MPTEKCYNHALMRLRLWKRQFLNGPSPSIACRRQALPWLGPLQKFQLLSWLGLALLVAIGLPADHLAFAKPTPPVLHENVDIPVRYLVGASSTPTTSGTQSLAVAAIAQNPNAPATPAISTSTPSIDKPPGEQPNQ